MSNGKNCILQTLRYPQQLFPVIGRIWEDDLPPSVLESFGSQGSCTPLPFGHYGQSIRVSIDSGRGIKGDQPIQLPI